MRLTFCIYLYHNMNTLSNKQKWRRSLGCSMDSWRTRKRRGGSSPPRQLTVDEIDGGTVSVDSTSNHSSQDSDESIPASGEEAISDESTHTSSTSCSSQCNSMKKRGVTFDEEVLVVLIPALKDYHAAGLWGDLWWGREDYDRFNEAFKIGIQRFLNCCRCEHCRCKVLDLLSSEQLPAERTVTLTATASHDHEAAVPMVPPSASNEIALCQQAAHDDSQLPIATPVV